MRRGDPLGREDSAAVRVIAEDGGDIDEFAFGKELVGIVRHEVVVDRRAVHVQRRVLGAWQRCVEVLGLQVLDGEAAQAGKGVASTSASRPNYEVVIHELALRECVDIPKGLALGGSGMEKPVITAAIGG